MPVLCWLSATCPTSVLCCWNAEIITDVVVARKSVDWNRTCTLNALKPPSTALLEAVDKVTPFEI